MLDINAFAIRGANPDCTFLLDLPAEEGLDRIARRSEATQKALDRIESEELSFHQRVRAGYLELAERYADRFTVVDARQDPDAITRLQPFFDDSPGACVAGAIELAKAPRPRSRRVVEVDDCRPVRARMRVEQPAEVAGVAARLRTGNHLERDR